MLPVIRRAELADTDAIAAAHLDSISTIGPDFYGPEIVKEWRAGLSADVYARAMRAAKHSSLPLATLAARRASSGLPRIGLTTIGTERPSMSAVRRQGGGIGSALYRLAEAHALAAGAGSIEIYASLAAVNFYRANGFEETGKGEHHLMSGQSMACVFMVKKLRR